LSALHRPGQSENILAIALASPNVMFPFFQIPEKSTNYSRNFEIVLLLKPRKVATLKPMALAYKQFHIIFGGTKNWLMKIFHLLSHCIISAFPLKRR
jgi:hypothetical protein